MSDSLSNTYQDNTNSQLHQLNQFGHAEAQIIYQMNKFRFKSQPIIAKLKNILTQRDPNSSYITLHDINKQIHYQDQTILQRLIQYLDNMDAINQILPDLSTNFKFNELFKKKFGNYLQQQKQILDTTQIDNLKKTLKSPIFYGYLIQDVKLNNISELIIMIIIEEFIQLNEDSNTSDRHKSLKIEHNLQHIPDQLALLSQDFTTICVATVQTDEIIQIQDNDQVGSSYNVYILLSASDYFQDIPTTKNSMKKITKGYTTLPTYKSQNTITKQQNNKLNRVPQKYKNPIQKTSQIPRTSIIKLIEKLDTNNDGYITVDDIVKFTQNNFLFYSKEVLNQYKLQSQASLINV